MSRTVTIVDVYATEVSTNPDRAKTTLTLYGYTPGGQDLTLKVEVPLAAIGFIGVDLNQAIRDHSAMLDRITKQVRSPST